MTTLTLQSFSVRPFTIQKLECATTHYGRVFRNDGVPEGGTILIKEVSGGNKPTVASLNDGGFLVAWTEYKSYSDNGVYAQKYQADGTKLGDEMVLQEGQIYSWRTPEVTSLDDGGFVLVLDGFTAKRFNADGENIGELQPVGGQTPFDQPAWGIDKYEVEQLSADLFAITYSRDDDVFKQLFAWENNLIGDDTYFGGEGNNYLLGTSGDDRLDGGPGVDTMVGGLGNDIYVVDNEHDIVVETNEDLSGLDKVFSSATYTLPENVEDIILIGVRHRRCW